MYHDVSMASIEQLIFVYGLILNDWTVICFLAGSHQFHRNAPGIQHCFELGPALRELATHEAMSPMCCQRWCNYHLGSRAERRSLPEPVRIFENLMVTLW